MAQRKSVSVEETPPLATSGVAEPALDKAAIERQTKFKAMRAELHAEKVYVAPPPTAPAASVPIQSPAEKRAAEEKVRQDAILAGNKGRPRFDWVVDRILLPPKAQQKQIQIQGPSLVIVPPTTGFTGQKITPRTQPTEYDTLAATLKFDVENGDVELEDARMILRAYRDLGLPMQMALKSEPAVIRAWVAAHPAREATQDSVAIAKGRQHDDRLLDALQKETGKVSRPSEKAVLWRICLSAKYNKFVSGFVEPGPSESRASAQKRAETIVVNFLLTPPSGTLASTPKKGAPAGPYGDLGLAPDGITERNAARPAPENIAFAPEWGEVRTEEGTWDRVTRQQILAVRVKGASELDVGRKTRIGGNQATTTPSKPRPLSEPWMKASQDRGTDPRVASAPPRSISRRVDKARRYVDSAARAEVSYRWDYSNPGPLNK